MNKCLDCKFFQSANNFRDETDSMPGECRRHAPVLPPAHATGRAWPSVYASHGCGDFEYEPIVHGGYDRRQVPEKYPQP